MAQYVWGKHVNFGAAIRPFFRSRRVYPYLSIAPVATSAQLGQDTGRPFYTDDAHEATLADMVHSYIRPNTHVALRLPSGILKVVELKPNTYVA